MAKDDKETINLTVRSGEKTNGHHNYNDDDDDNDSNGVEHDDPTILPNRTGAEIDEEASNAEEMRLPEYNYSTISRWQHRALLWNQFMTNTSQSKEFPTKEAFLYSDDPPRDKNSVEHLIWGPGDDSLKSLYSTLETDQSELVALQNDNSIEIESSFLESIMSTDEAEPKSAEDLSHLKLNSEQLAYIEDQKKKAEQARIKAHEELIKAQEKAIKAQEKAIKAQEKAILERVERIIERHKRKRNVLTDLGEKGNGTEGSAGRTVSCDVNRIDESAEPPPSDVLQIMRTDSDPNFLKELLDKREILNADTKKHLCELQAFVANLIEKADTVTQQDGVAGKTMIKASVDAILQWTPGTTVESLEETKANFGRPPAQAGETTADQPILCALMFQILDIVGRSTTSVSSEQLVAPVYKGGRHRRVDFVVDEYREFLHVVFPEKLGRVIEVKAAGMEVKDPSKYERFENNQEKAREQVIGHLAKQLLCAFDFGGIGQDDVVRGIVLSMVSVQVLEMRLTNIGTYHVDIGYCQTPHVPLFRSFELPQGVQTKFDWDMESNGVLLLASAMVDIPRMSLFGYDNEKIHCKIDDYSAKAWYSSSDQEAERHVGIEILSLLGSGSFAHVVELGDNMFMKIPRSRRVVKSVKRECELLKKLQPGDNEPWFPRTMSWGVSVVNLFIRNEISQMEVLRLTGIVGVSLGNYCKTVSPEPNYIHHVIQEVYKALEFAHSKEIYHMDVRPSNIVVKSKGNGNDNVLNVLLADWGCSMMRGEKIEKGRFVGCPPYAHDELLGERDQKALIPKAKYDFASLGFTWYHAIARGIDWQFDRPKQVSPTQLEERRKKLEEFFQLGRDDGTAVRVPNVLDIFVRSDKKREKRTLEDATR